MSRDQVIHPDAGDPTWLQIEHDTRTLACMDADHRACSLPDFCQCLCHLPEGAP